MGTALAALRPTNREADLGTDRRAPDRLTTEAATATSRRSGYTRSVGIDLDANPDRRTARSRHSSTA